MNTKWIRWTLFTGFAGFLLLGAFLQLNSVRERAKVYLIETLQSETGYIVEIGSLKLFPSFQIAAGDIVISDDEKALIALDHLHLGIYPFELLFGKLHLSTLHIENASILSLPEKMRASKERPSQLRIAIDDLFLDNVYWKAQGIEAPDFSLLLKGSLNADLQKENIYANFKFSSSQFPGQWVSADFCFEEGKGVLHLKKDAIGKASLEFEWKENQILSIPRFFAKWDSFSIDGKLTLSKEGEIEESSLFLIIDDLSGYTPFSGALFGEAVVSGPLLHPKFDLYLISDSLQGYDQQLENVKLRVSTVNQGRFSLSFQKNEHPYSFSGSLLQDQETFWLPSQIDLRLPMEEIAQLISWDAAAIGGQLLIQARLQNEELQLRAELLDGVFESFELGSRFIDVHGIVEGGLDTLKLTQFFAKDTENGTYQGEGEVIFDKSKNFPFTCKLILDKARPFLSDIAKSAFSGFLIVSGDSEQASLKGDLSSYLAEVSISEKLPESSTAIQIAYINQPEDEAPPTQPSRFTFSWPVILGINLVVADKLKIEGGGLNSFWDGKVHIGGTLVKPKTKGELKLREGRFLFRGKHFEFKQGSITFNGDPEKNTLLFLAAEMDFTDLTVEASLKGPILNPSITLTSSPPMSQRAILSWLLFGKGIAEINPMEEKQLSRSLRSLLDQVDDQPDLLNRVGDVLGLDQVEIGASPTGKTGDLTVRVGKYLTDETCVSVSRSISQGKDADKDTSCFGIETKLGRHIRFRAEGDTETNGRLNILWKNEY